MTNLEEIQKIIEESQRSGEHAFITALKVTNVYERVTNHQVEILEGNICITTKNTTHDIKAPPAKFSHETISKS